MARIRTIKPEFPQSESMGRVSRDARLLFVLLWNICDDHGRTRAASRMLASLLFPYDDDAPKLLPDWIGELEAEGCIRLYVSGGSTYLEICNWLKHQKIDKPGKPVFPAFDDNSTPFANVRESSPLDQGSRTKDQGEEEKHICASDDAPPTKSDPIPYQSIVDTYNRTMTGLAKVQVISAKRRTAIRSVWNASPKFQAPRFFESFFAECQDSAFLNGTGPYTNGHENWRPDFDYLMTPKVATRVYERAMQQMEEEGHGTV